MLSNISTLTKVATTTAAVLLAVWIPYAKYRWKRRLDDFVKEHGSDEGTSHDEEHDILLVVNPASGGGKSLALYDTVLQQLKATGRPVQVVVTKSSDHVQRLTRLYDMSSYKVIAIMGGDSTLTEFVEYELIQNKGKWPYAPILHVPGGTGNAIAREMFSAGSNVLPSVEEIIQHGLTKSRRAAVLEITSPSMKEPRYALHNCFDGAQRHMLADLDACRAHLYPAFGSIIVLPIVLASILFRMPRGMSIPYLLAIISDTEGLDTQLGFGMDRFDDQMVILYVKQWPGALPFLRLFVNFMSGQLAEDWRNDNLPDWIHVEKANRYTLEGDEKSFHMYLDGGGNIPCQGQLPITFRVIPDAMPYFVHDGLIEETKKKDD